MDGTGLKTSENDVFPLIFIHFPLISPIIGSIKPGGAQQADEHAACGEGEEADLEAGLSKDLVGHEVDGGAHLRKATARLSGEGQGHEHLTGRKSGVEVALAGENDGKWMKMGCR